MRKFKGQFLFINFDLYFVTLLHICFPMASLGFIIIGVLNASQVV